MAESENDSKFDEIERDSLQKAISEVERSLLAAGTGARAPLVNFLANAKGRVAFLEKRIKESGAEREARAQEHATLVALAQKETALNVEEKETYGGFLEKGFFTKRDFPALEKFYAETWERLSEGGKDEMSHRVWEGIRREEFKFSELPAFVQQKEAKHLYGRLTGSTKNLGDASAIPEKDRQDFVRAYEDGNKAESYRVLERESFRKNVALGSSRAIGHMEAQLGKETAGQAIVQIKTNVTPRDVPEKTTGPGDSLASLDLSSVDLNSLKVPEADSQSRTAEGSSFHGSAGGRRR